MGKSGYVIDPDEIRRVRVAAGYSQERLARALGVDYVTVWSWEKGRYTPNPRNLSRFARICRVDPNTLFKLEDDNGE